MVNVLEFDETNRIGLFNNTLFCGVPFIGVANNNNCFLRRNSKLRGSTKSLLYFIRHKTFSTLTPEEELVTEETQQCISIEDISRLEINARKDELIAKLNGRDYETYIKQFWVGLLDGDGILSTSGKSSNCVIVRFSIALKNLRDNVIMLLLIQEVVGGTVRINRQDKYVTWVATKKEIIQKLFLILDDYPLLTTRKQCFLQFAKDCIASNTATFVNANRALMFNNQHNLINSYEVNFLKPYYFDA